MCYNYTGSKFRFSMPYFNSVGIIFSKHSIAHQGRTQNFSKGVSKEGIAKAISTAHFMRMVRASPVLGKICDAQGGFRKLRKPPAYAPAHPLQSLGDFQGRVVIVLSMHTPTEYQCLQVLCKHKKLYTCDVMGH